jgi:hypothetical protein
MSVLKGAETISVPDVVKKSCLEIDVAGFVNIGAADVEVKVAGFDFANDQIDQVFLAFWHDHGVGTIT